MFQFLRRWLDGDGGSTAFTPKQTGVRLGLERLPDLTLLTNLFWSPPSQNNLLANTAGNWLVGSPLGVPSTVAPGSNDHLYFRQNNSNWNCLITPLATTANHRQPPARSLVST